jgi:hypothetical protein
MCFIIRTNLLQAHKLLNLICFTIRTNLLQAHPSILIEAAELIGVLTKVLDTGGLIMVNLEGHQRLTIRGIEDHLIQGIEEIIGTPGVLLVHIGKIHPKLLLHPLRRDRNPILYAGVVAGVVTCRESVIAKPML